MVDMDLVDGRLLERLRDEVEPSGQALPVVALTRRGDLATKLAAFEHGVDDILTVPFSTRGTGRPHAGLDAAHLSGREFPFRPVLHLGELEIDILNRWRARRRP